VLLLRSKVARRLLWMFLACAVVPIAILGGLTFHQVSSSLREQSRERLRQASKSAGVLILERLNAVRDFVRDAARGSHPAEWNAATVPIRRDAPELVESATLVRPDGRRIALFGDPIAPLARPPGALASLGRLEPRPTRDGVKLILEVPLEGSGGGAGASLACELDARRLLASSVPNALPPHAEFCVATTSGRLLDCSLPALEPQLEGLRLGLADHRGSLETDVAGVPYLASHWSLFLDAQLDAEGWNVFVLEPLSEALGPLVEFRTVFAAAGLACFGIVFLASAHQIRRRMEPLDELQAATQHVAAGRFDVAVQVASDDEFRDLATSFNSMTRRLAEHFALLARQIDLDRRILSSNDERSIVRALLDGVHTLHPCDGVCILLRDADQASRLVGRLRWLPQRRPIAFTSELAEAEAAELGTGTGVVDLDVGAALPRFLEPLAGLGARRVRLLPLWKADGLNGLLALVWRGEAPRIEADPTHARQVADQAAVALVNARTAELNRFLAHRDPLTGLANRLLFHDRLEQALAAARRKGSLVAVCLLDLDRFKAVNDSLGHAAGDRLLQQVARRLAEWSREGALARMGGDEFTLLLEEPPSPEVCSVAARRLLEALARPFALDGREVFVTGSLGIAVHPLDGADAGTLLKHADAAMYDAKEQGGNRCAFFTRQMSERAARRIAVESALRRALERDEVLASYQPIAEAASGEWVGFEVLARWTSPELGVVSPSEFIPVAEESGLIAALGERILRSACAQARAWQLRCRRDFHVAVNLSCVQLRERDLPQRVAQVLADTGFDPHSLVLELTESELMEEGPSGREQIAALRRLGLRVSIDDFGTGYSSLGYLKSFVIDSLKIDRGFLGTVGDGGPDDAIVRAIVGLGHGLGLVIVAEGVERPEQLAALRALGCDLIQGFLIGPALAVEEVEKRMAEWA
jgi:diguanylate cyclase (GGDEF)-like protein